MNSGPSTISIRRRMLIAAGIGAALLIFVGANVHLLYVAFDARAECVDHIKVAGERGATDRFRAARSSC